MKERLRYIREYVATAEGTSIAVGLLVPADGTRVYARPRSVHV